MPKSRRKRTTYSDTKRQTILKAAQKQGLTALEVKKRFGVTPVTYYSWRRKYGAGGSRVTAGRPTGRSAGVETQVRSEVQARVREILPRIVRTEVSQYLDSVFRSSRGRARKA